MTAPIPPGHEGLIPHIVVSDAAKAAFGYPPVEDVAAAPRGGRRSPKSAEQL